MGCDLSKRTDLVALVLTTRDPAGVIQVLPFVFCPTSGIEERARHDRAPYDLWVREGHMIAVGGKVMDFDQIAEAIKAELDRLGIEVHQVQYDKHMIEHFQAACARAGVLQGAEWVGVPQYFKDMGVRLDSLITKMSEGKLRHGGSPPLAMAATHAVAKIGREGVAALAKDSSAHRIDALVALVMAAWPFGDGEYGRTDFDAATMIG
jgi:phage terminase large subunit-like protein